MDSEASSSESNEHKILFEAHAFLLERMLNYERIEPTDLPLALLAKITNYFSDDMQIGHGGFAVVYKGRLGRGKMVAVKKLSEKIDMDETKYNQEVDCLMRVKHRNIVRFLGYCANTHVKRSEYQGKFVMADVRHRLLCFEYLSKGSLRNYISDASCGLDWAKRYEIIKGICEGLSYLHEKRIVHLDLKPENILLNEDMVPKISDFGLSRCFDEDQTRAMASKLLGSTGYMAPEFYDKVITTKSDIYSLGVIFTEILTGQKGYSTQKNVVECWRNRSEGSLSETLLEQVSVCAEISIDCMNFDPTKRPDVRSIIHKLAGTESTNDDFSKFGTTTSLMAQPSRNNLHLPRGKLPVPSFNADAILEDKSSTRRFAMISSARANCTRVVSAVIVKIDTVLADETAKAVVEKHHGEAVELQNKIRNIRERLTFMAKMSKVCMSSDAWCEKMRNLAYRVEDMMDKYFYYSFKMKDESFLKKIITESHNADVFSEIADELVKVDMEIENIKKINDMRSPSSLDVLDDLIEKERQRSQVSFQEFLKHEDLVGIEDNRRMLTEWLYFDELQNTVITVSGMGGLGKTVLVADVYKHEMINFPSHAWITVSQTYNVDALLRKLLREIDYIEYLSAHIEDMDVYELKVEIRRRLKDRDCLIVLDDVWSKDVYFQMFDGLQNMQGIRIIITTRKNHVAALAPPTRRLDLKPLSNTHAFNLFCRITLHDDECPKELEQCATSILARCLGLPSAIVSIGRLLSSGPHTCDFWGQMYYEARNELPDNDIMRAILEPSYYDLSEDLKNCFLYCSLFPEDYQFSCESLVRMWVAEGFVLSRGNHTPEEVAEGNLMELIDCNLLLAMQNDEQGRVVSCKMHGILRDLAHAVAKKEKFHFTNDYYSLTRMKRDTVRRLSLCRWYDERIIKFRFPHLRTLVSLGTVSSSTATLSSILSESMYLTVLELQDSEVTEVPESLGILFNLRYIGLRRTKVKSLPETIVKLSNLQTLDIKETKIQNLPRRMGNVKKLRHLFADRYADNQENFPCIFGMQPPKHLLNSSESPYIFGVQPPNDLLSLEYLETLETVQSTSDLPDQLKKLWRLRSVWIDNINTADCETLFVTLSNLPLLSSLLLCARDGNEELRITKLSRVKLRRLITIGQWAPGTLGCSAFSVGRYLNHLAISWCYLGRDSLNMLAREVPCLTYLKLSNVYGAEILDVTKGSFPELKTLVLEYMDDVDNLVLRYGALPMIEALYIVSLTKLDKVPHGLESLAHLKKLWLLNLHTNFRAQWHKNGMHNKMQHVTEIRI